MPDQAITLSQASIHNPNEPRHFMRLKPARRRIRIYFGDSMLAETANAIRLMEVGKDFYDPVFYIPQEDIQANLGQNRKTTHCPLKGDTRYFDLLGTEGSVLQENIAWCYTATLEIAAELKGLIAFDPSLITVVESPS